MTFPVHAENIRMTHAVVYLRQQYGDSRQPLIVVIDRLNFCRAAVRQLRQSGARWLHVEWLPV
jgi:hypothetical protein